MSSRCLFSEILRYTDMLKADEKMASADSQARWDNVWVEVQEGASVGFKMVKDKTLSNWEGEADISNVGLLHAQTDKWAALWQE